MSENMNTVHTAPRLDLKWEGNSRGFRIGKPVTLLGRSKDCDIRFSNVAVEDIHAAILFKDGQWQLANDCATDKLWVNGEALGEGDRRSLKEGDCIDLAHREYLIVHFPTEEETAEAPGKSRKGLVAALAAVLALVLLAAGFCGGSYLGAKKSLENGEYAAAAATAGRVAFLAGDIEQEAWFKLASQNTDEGELEAALGAAMNVSDAAQRDKLLEKLLNAAVKAEDYVFSEAVLDSMEDAEKRDMGCILLADAVIRKDENVKKAAELLDRLSNEELRVSAYYALGQDLYSFNDTDAAIAILSYALDDKQVEELYDDCWLRKVNKALKDGDYTAALAAADEVIGKTAEAEALCGEIYYAQAEEARAAGDYAAALELYRGAGETELAPVYVSILDPLLDGFYFTAAEAVQENTDALPYTNWHGIFKEKMGEPEKLADVLVQMKVNRILADSWFQPLDAEAIETINRNETDGLTNRIGPMDPYDDTEKLMLLGEGMPELEACGSGTGKALIVRTQQDYPRGAVYAAVESGLMNYLPTELLPASLNEVDYIIYIDHDYSKAGTGHMTGTMGGSDVDRYVTTLKVNSVLRVVDMKTGEELYRSGTIQADNQYQLLFATDDWVPSVNPPIGDAFAEAVAAIPY